jgi:nitroreductase
MELRKGLKTRRSIRSFKKTSIPDKLIGEILELANAAPSAGNIQAREFIVARKPSIKKALSKAAHGQEFINEAPVVIVVCGNQNRSAAGYGRRGSDFYSIQDADASIMHILLAAYSLELGTCWVGAFNDDKVSSILNLPNFIRPIAIIPIGYPSHIPKTTSRIQIERLVHYDKW